MSYRHHSLRRVLHMRPAEERDRKEESDDPTTHAFETGLFPPRAAASELDVREHDALPGSTLTPGEAMQGLVPLEGDLGREQRSPENRDGTHLDIPPDSHAVEENQAAKMARAKRKTR